jgi:hypothetical protein
MSRGRTGIIPKSMQQAGSTANKRSPGRDISEVLRLFFCSSQSSHFMDPVEAAPQILFQESACRSGPW